ncbi:hypothetical protein T4D_2936 [Trichinella pseudospiralis]|uniref:Uncharacterized protein n=1 Tax=Trichinella pseudospiralis TaxID=6337 RepID=A0A0V1FWR7_TRIPS|nr:hypothetical protein T4D_2936 [Trichinella pseudospiralis]
MPISRHKLLVLTKHFVQRGTVKEIGRNACRDRWFVQRRMRKSSHLLVLQQYSVGGNLKFQHAREEAAKTSVCHILQGIAVLSIKHTTMPISRHKLLVLTKHFVQREIDGLFKEECENGDIYWYYNSIQ